MQQDSVLKTFVVAGVLCVVCSIFVATAAVALKPYQEANKTLDKRVNILVAAGLVDLSAGYPDAGEVETLFECIRPIVVDMKSGAVFFDEESLHKAENPSPGSEIAIARENDVARVRHIPQYAFVYVYKDAGTPITTMRDLHSYAKRYVFPIEGQGLWATMYGFIALEPDLNTISSINFYQQGETAGLGGEIANPAWQRKWVDKVVFAGKASEPTITILKYGFPNERDDQVDGIAGSTLTCKGVQNTVRFWLGQRGYGPFVNKIKMGDE